MQASSLLTTLLLFFCPLSTELVAQAPDSSRPDPLARARELAGAGEHEAAVQEYLEVLGIAEQHFGGDSPDICGLLNEIGFSYFHLGDLENAERFFRRAVDNGAREEPIDHQRQATMLNNLAALYQRLESFAEAEPLYLEARDLLRTELGPSHRRAIFLDGELGVLYLKMGRVEEGIEALSSYLEASEGAEWADPLETAERWQALGQALGQQGRTEEALAASGKGIRLLETKVSPEDPRFLAGLSARAVELAEAGSFEEAEETFRRLLELQEKVFGARHLSIGVTLGNLASLRSQQGRRDEALDLARQSSTHLLASCGSSRDAPICSKAFERHAILLESLGVGTDGDQELVGGVAAEGEPEVAHTSPGSTDAAGARATKGVFRAQLRSFQDRVEAESVAAELAEQYSEVLAGVRSVVEQVELEGRGTWFRVQFGEFEEASAARRLCNRLAAAGLEGCWVARGVGEP